MHLHQDDPIGYYCHRSGDGATPGKMRVQTYLNGTESLTKIQNEIATKNLNENRTEEQQSAAESKRAHDKARAT